MKREIDIPDHVRVHVEDMGQTIARFIGDTLKDAGLDQHFGFAVLLFSFKPGFLTHLSNARRADMVKAFREAADVLERRADEPPLRSPRH